LSRPSDGDIVADANPKVSADYLISVLYGITVLTRHGKSRDELHGIEEQVANALPQKIEDNHQ
jgi:hypothetical protein